jgi:LPXTG-motif cell wall-anchored protein
MAHHIFITRLTCGSAAACAAVFLVIASAGTSTAAEPNATNVLASSLRFSPTAATSGHSLTRLVEMGVQSPSSDPTPAATSAHSLTRLVEMGVQVPSRPPVQRAALGREDAATGIEASQVALSALGGVVLAGAWALARRRRRTPHTA